MLQGILYISFANSIFLLFDHWQKCIHLPLLLTLGVGVVNGWKLCLKQVSSLLA